MINFSKTTLPNGMRVITAPIKHTKSVTVMAIVGAGSRYEEKTQAGISHFLEHVFFKGTKKRPTTLDITHELDAVGAGFNAFTSEEETGFYVRAENSHFDLSLDILADILLNSKFDPAELEKEKGVILEEIRMYQDIPQRHVQELNKKLLFGDSALGWSVAGDEDTVKRFSRDNVLNYLHGLYVPENMVMVVAGNPEKTDWIRKINERFSSWTGKQKVHWTSNSEIQKTPAISVHNKKTDQAHLVLSVKTFAREDPRRYTLQVINNILGDTMSSWLFTEVREKRALAYYISSDISNFHDTGFFSVSAGVDLKRVHEAIKIILETITRIKKGVSAKEINDAKENFKGRLYLGLEDSMSVASFLAEQEILRGKIETPEEIVEKIMLVKNSDIISLSEEIFRTEKLNLALVGPYQNKQEFRDLLKLP